MWLYRRFALSLRDVQDLLAERGVVVTIGGKRRYLWRAVDRDGDVLAILDRKRKDAGPQSGSFESY